MFEVIPLNLEVLPFPMEFIYCQHICSHFQRNFCPKNRMKKQIQPAHLQFYGSNSCKLLMKENKTVALHKRQKCGKIRIKQLVKSENVVYKWRSRFEFRRVLKYFCTFWTFCEILLNFDYQFAYTVAFFVQCQLPKQLQQFGKKFFGSKHLDATDSYLLNIRLLHFMDGAISILFIYIW